MGAFFERFLLKGNYVQDAVIENLINGMFYGKNIEITNDREEADYEVKLRFDLNGWTLLYSDYSPGKMDKCRKQACNIALAAGENCVYIRCLDSDEIIFVLADGKKSETMKLNLYEKHDDCDKPKAPNRMWKSKILEHYQEFSDLFTEEYVCAEDIIDKMARYTGWPEDLLDQIYAIENDTKAGDNIKVVYIKERETSFFVNRYAAPCLQLESFYMMGNPAHKSFFSTGGETRGIKIEFRAHGFNPEEYDFQYCFIRSLYEETRTDNLPEKKGELSDKLIKKIAARGYTMVNPKLAVFQDDSVGWIAEFPDLKIRRGVNANSPAFKTVKGDDYLKTNDFVLGFSMTGERYISDEDSGYIKVGTCYVKTLKDDSIPKGPYIEIRILFFTDCDFVIKMNWCLSKPDENLLKHNADFFRRVDLLPHQ